MSYWIWYQGDFERWHAMKQNFSRVERGLFWPAFWKSEGIRNRIALSREYVLDEETSFTVHARGSGFVLVNEEKHSFESVIKCGPGKVKVTVHLGRLDALPSALVEGDVISSGPGWISDDYAEKLPAGCNKLYTDPAQDPAEWDYTETEYRPVRIERVCGGTLYKFETELTASLEIRAPETRLRHMTVYCGESRAEALAGKDCYLFWEPEITGSGASAVGHCPRCALRYVFIEGEPVELTAVYQYVDFPVRTAFACDDPKLNQIWNVAEHTFRLCSGIFFLDGIKRDGWIWSGDAYQSLLISRYLLVDPGVEQRTLVALRGNDPMTAHINTIVDYSLLWVLGVKEHLETFHDREFLGEIYPKVRSLIGFCMRRTDESGFLVGMERDWTFIDWADIDKDGPVGAIEMLYYAALSAAADLASMADDQEFETLYRAEADRIRECIREHFWSQELGAFIDSFTSGRCHVSRQTNLLAIRCGIADEEQTRLVSANVLHSDKVPPISTPYFQFFALDVMGQVGEIETVLDVVRSYWGGMLDLGAVTFWEEFDPSVTGDAQYGMYGDPFGKSLCHAWAASPIYLISRYLIGLEICEDGDDRFVLTPHLELFGVLECTLPVGENGQIVLSWDGRTLRVKALSVSGKLRVWGQEISVNNAAAVEVQLP